MVTSLPYSPIHSPEWFEKFFRKNFNKLNYNKFFWWRSYVSKTKPLHSRTSLKDRILNGDFEISPYRLEAELVEHRLNQKYLDLINDPGKYVEESSVDRARRKRLLEDFDKDESEKLKSLETAFLVTFKINKEQYNEEVTNFNGELIDFYFFIDEKYGTYWQPLKTPTIY